ncbi:MAG: hypothetical protein ACI4N3_04880 [Alphaproteobacteria bacterium]
MIGLSSNGVEAAPRSRRSMSSSSSATTSSSRSTVLSSTETSSDRDDIIYNTLKDNIFNRYQGNYLYIGVHNKIKKLFNKDLYSYFEAYKDKFSICFTIESFQHSDLKIDGDFLLDDSNTSFKCYDNPTEIYISETTLKNPWPVGIFIYKRGEVGQGHNFIDAKEVDIKPLSSLISKDTMQKVKDTCKFESYYKDIKNLLVASTVTSGVAAASGATGTVLSVVDTVKDKKEGDTDKKLSGMNIADIALSGTSAATSMASAITNFVSVEKINKLSSQVNKCVENAKSLNEEFREIFEEFNSINQKSDIFLYEKVSKKCMDLSKLDKTIKDVKTIATASGVTSMVGAAASGASIATTVIGNTSDPDKVDGNKMNIASTVASGIGSAGALGGTVINATNITKIQDLINGLESCTEAINEHL